MGIISMFKNMFVSPNMAAILHFQIFSQKIAKDKNAYILKIMLDRGISTKFLTHRIFPQSSQPYFQNIFVSPKMTAILHSF